MRAVFLPLLLFPFFHSLFSSILPRVLTLFSPFFSCTPYPCRSRTTYLFRIPLAHQSLFYTTTLRGSGENSSSSSSIPSLRMENGAIDPPPPSNFVSGCNLSLSLGLKSEMSPLFVYCSTPCLARPSSSTLALRCPRKCNLRIFVRWHS